MTSVLVVAGVFVLGRVVVRSRPPGITTDRGLVVRRVAMIGVVVVLPMLLLRLVVCWVLSPSHSAVG